MGLYKYLQKAWKQKKFELKDKILDWKNDPVTIRIDKPTRLDRARALGYRAKQGIFIVRQRIGTGGRRNPQIRKGRRSKHRVYRKDLNMNYKWVAEQRVSKKYPNCEVLNSYFVAKKGAQAWYEIIMVDTSSPEIMKDSTLSWITTKNHTHRVERGLTASAKKSRGLFKKGKGAEKIRPSAGANKNRHK